MEQRVCVKFCFKIGKSASETYELLKEVFGDECLSRSNVFIWFQRFKDGRQSVEDDPRSGRPSSSKTDENIVKVRDLVRSDRRLTIREMADELNLSFYAVQSILTENLNMRRVSAKFIPKLLTDQQKQHRLEVSQDLINRAETDPDLLNRVITGDESWVYGYDPETKAQSSQWKSPGSPRPKKARQSRSNVKTMLVIFIDSTGIVHHEFSPSGQTVNQEYYKSVLQRLRENVRKKRPALWRDKTWVLHHDNAPAHRAFSITEFLTKFQIPVLPQPPYSPDIAPADFYLFPKLKFSLKGHRFDSIEDIQANTEKVLNTLKKEHFQECFQKWKHRWNRCVQSEGDYFEGDPSQ